MARIRDPARHTAYLLWEEAGGKKAPKGILKEIADKLNKSEVLIRKWKSNDKWEKSNVTNKSNGNVTNDKGNVTNKKKLIKQAKAIVVNGGTLKEASEQTSVNLRTLETYSSKENWMQEQEKFLQKVYSKLQEKHGEQHIQRRERAIDMLHQLSGKAFIDLASGKLDKDNASVMNTVVNIVLNTIKGQSDLLGIPEMKMYIRKDKEENAKTSNDRTINIKVVK